jgi:hypothetical protein
MADLLQEQREFGSSASKASNYRSKQIEQTDQTEDKGYSKQQRYKKPYKKDARGPRGPRRGSKSPEKGAKNSASPATFMIRDSLDDIGVFDSSDDDEDRPNRSRDLSAMPDPCYRDLSAMPDPFIEDLSAMPDPLGLPTSLNRLKSAKSSAKSARNSARALEPTKKSKALLYDTGSTCHLINNREAFTDYHPLEKGKTRPITTGGGPIFPLGFGTAEFSVLVSLKPLKYRPLVLKRALYFPGIDVSIVSGILHILSGGSIRGARLFTADNEPCGLFYYKEHGFFLQQQGIETPKQEFQRLKDLNYSYLATKVIVEIPSKPPVWAREGEFEDYTESSRQQRSRTLADRPTDQREPSKAPDPIPLLAESTGDLQQEQRPSLPPLRPEDPYKRLLQQAGIWHIRLGHLGLALLKKTAKISEGIPDLSAVKDADFYCLACIRANTTRSPSREPIPDPAEALDVIEGDTFSLSPIPIAKTPIGLILVDRKTRYKWVFLLPNKEGPIVLKTVQTFLKGLELHYKRVPKRFHYDGGREINRALQALITKKGTIYSALSPYIHEQNGLAERSIRTLLQRLRAVII